jgi:hypothetical protein
MIINFAFMKIIYSFMKIIYKRKILDFYPVRCSISDMKLKEQRTEFEIRLGEDVTQITKIALSEDLGCTNITKSFRMGIGEPGGLLR